MGEDQDIVVLGFKLEDKYPAIDLMEFIEKGYSFILDADMSTGEEHDGKYQVFVELERTRKLPKQIKDMLEGIGQLCDCKEWKFRYYGKPDTLGFSEEAIMENVPLDGIAYDQRMLESRKKEIKEFFDQGNAANEMKYFGQFPWKLGKKLVTIAKQPTQELEVGPGIKILV